MSYDLYLFRRPDHVSLDEINAFLQSESYDAFLDDKDDDEAEDFDAMGDELPEEFIDYSVPLETLEKAIGKAYLRQIVSSEDRSAEIAAYLESDNWEEEAPDDCQDALSCFFDFEPSRGMFYISFDEGEHIRRNIAMVTRMLTDLAEWRVTAMDPQLGAAYDDQATYQEAVRAAIEAEGGYAPEDEDVTGDPQAAFMRVGALLQDFHRYCEAGQETEGLRRIQEAWELFGMFADDPEMIDLKRTIKESMGFVQFDMGDYDACVESLRESLAIGDEPAASIGAHLILGAALHRLGRDEEAKDPLKIALKLGSAKVFDKMDPALLDLAKSA